MRALLLLGDGGALLPLQPGGAMTESGVIPPPEERRPPRYIGAVTDGRRALVEFITSGASVRLNVPSRVLYLDKGRRDEFMRLWCEAERQAEATMPP